MHIVINTVHGHQFLWILQYALCTYLFIINPWHALELLGLHVCQSVFPLLLSMCNEGFKKLKVAFSSTF